jgi:hypothetical protein
MNNKHLRKFIIYERERYLITFEIGKICIHNIYIHRGKRVHITPEAIAFGDLTINRRKQSL